MVLHCKLSFVVWLPMCYDLLHMIVFSVALSGATDNLFIFTDTGVWLDDPTSYTNKDNLVHWFPIS